MGLRPRSCLRHRSLPTLISQLSILLGVPYSTGKPLCPGRALVCLQGRLPKLRPLAFSCLRHRSLLTVVFQLLIYPGVLYSTGKTLCPGRALERLHGR